MSNMPWLKKDDTKTVEVMGVKFVVKQLSFGDSRKSIQGALKYNPVTKQNELDQTLAGVLRTLKMVQEWELTDRDGKPLPITLETIDMLDESFVAEMIQVMNAEDESEVPEDEKK